MFLNAKTPPGFGYLVPGVRVNRVPCKTRIQIRRFMHYLSDIIPSVDERDGQGGTSIPRGATFLVEMLSIPKVSLRRFLSPRIVPRQLCPFRYRHARVLAVLRFSLNRRGETRESESSRVIRRFGFGARDVNGELREIPPRDLIARQKATSSRALRNPASFESRLCRRDLVSSSHPAADCLS